MRIKGIEGLTVDQLAAELDRGGKFVVYQYCVSFLLVTFKRASSIHFVRAGENAADKGRKYTLLSLLFGWWGLPWGPIHTISSVATNCGGGKDVTPLVLASMQSVA